MIYLIIEIQDILQKYVTIDDFASELRDGKNGVDGIGARGKKSIIII